MEHNEHARRKKHVVELYCFVAHAQHDATRMINTGEKNSGRNNVHVAGLNVTENQQDSGKESSRRRE